MAPKSKAGPKKRKAASSLKQGSLVSFFGASKKSKQPQTQTQAQPQSHTQTTPPQSSTNDGITQEQARSENTLPIQPVTVVASSPEKTHKNNNVSPKKHQVHDTCNEHFEPTSKKSRRITVSPSITSSSSSSKYKSNICLDDFDDEIPSDAEDALLEKADACTVKVAVRKNDHNSSSTQQLHHHHHQHQQQQSYSSVADGARHMKKVYDAGDHLPCLSQPQEFFDDMVHQLLQMPDPFRKATTGKAGPVKKGGIGSFFAKKPVVEPSAATGKPATAAKLDTAHKVLLPFLHKMKNRSLRVATMCSGTESPVLALDMLQKALDEACVEHGFDKELGIDTTVSSVLTIEHIFSCEIEPFKQAYIERNFSPPLLFRDIRELGQEEAHTAYGGLAKVPNTPGSVDILIAGTSCVDYSNLNNKQKKIDQEGESGQTFFGMMKWIDQAQPPIVILENVNGAPWEIKKKLFQDRGYVANWIRVDTKDYYIPHTRQRGYLFAVKACKGAIANRETKWQSLVGNFRRPASAALDAFMLPNDDPRVLRGRARLTAESSATDGDASGDRAGRVDWTKCETRHQFARSNEMLGDNRPLTGWSDTKATVMPPFAWNEWTNAQVHRIHDLMDINTLRLAKEGADGTCKTMVWNLSQNCDRDTMSKLGLCQCLTPTGVFYVSNRGGPLVGEELLSLQGIPVDDLMFTKESEANLKDLAGNAMTTTVVGAVAFAALLVGFESLGSRNETNTTETIRSLVPRPLQPPSVVSIEENLGEYEKSTLDLGPKSLSIDELKNLLKEAKWASKLCISEGATECHPIDAFVACKECGETCLRELAFPPRRYEEHTYEEINTTSKRTEPQIFEKKLLQYLPMTLVVNGIDTESLETPSGIKASLWKDWKQRVGKATSDGFRFTRISRLRIWTAHYFSDATGASIEVRFEEQGVKWLLFAATPHKQGALRTWLEKPVARLIVPASSPITENFSLTTGHWEVRLPVSQKVELEIQGKGEFVKSWRNRLGLKGEYENEKQYESLEIKAVGDHDLSSDVDGRYMCLPKCGGACGSLHKREDLKGFLFLESGRKSLPSDDHYVIANSCHRPAGGEYRESTLHLEKEYTPVLSASSMDHDSITRVNAHTPGKWTPVRDSSLNVPTFENNVDLVLPTSNPNDKVKLGTNAWMKASKIISATFPLTKSSKTLKPCFRQDEVEVNLLKSKRVFESMSFVTSRFDIPQAIQDAGWVVLDRSAIELVDGDDKACSKCSPSKPRTQWSIVEKGKKRLYIPVEEGREAAVFERSLKERPPAWVIRLSSCPQSSMKNLSISLNAVTLSQRAFGRFPEDSLVRRMALDTTSSPSIEYAFRIVPHVDRSSAKFNKLTFTSNKQDPEANQPPNFKRYPLRKEQLRSLSWMLKQERESELFKEEEVCEEVLPGLNWRAEAKATRPILVRGGIIADEVGYGKTACALGLIDSTSDEIPETPTSGQFKSLFPVKATCVIIPGHLIHQWKHEVEKFLENSKKVIVLDDMKSVSSTTFEDMMNADIILVSFKVLSTERYFRRLARLSGVNPDSFPSGVKGGRLFDAVYNECISNLPSRCVQMKQDLSTVFESIEAEAANHGRNDQRSHRLDRKKSVYAKGTIEKAKEGIKSEVKVSPLPANEKDPKDPWGFQKQKSLKKCKSPPLECFFFRRVIVDEFTYLEEKERERTASLLDGLASNSRWMLSGTPQHSCFDDIKVLAKLLGIHLGIDEPLPNQKSMGRGKKRNEESTGLENLSQFLEVRSMQWHERRHEHAQAFLDRFLRQNVAEIDEIPSESHVYKVEMPAAEKALYLELETYLQSLEMNAIAAKKSQKKSTSDKDSRMQKILRESSSAEEALLKCCTCNMEDQEDKIFAGVKDVMQIRKKEKKLLERRIVDGLSACFRQHHRILKLQPDWNNATRNEKGEVASALNTFLQEVDEHRSVSHGADSTVHQRIKKLARLAEAAFEIGEMEDRKSVSNEVDKMFHEVNVDSELFTEEGKISKEDCAKAGLEEKLYPLKRSLHNYMHEMRAMGKELCGRIRALRFVKHIEQMQHLNKSHPGQDFKYEGIPVKDIAILSSCGHVGSFKNIHEMACTENRCIDPDCQADVSPHHVVRSGRLNLDVEDHESPDGFGRKLVEIIAKVKEIISEGDRAIVFVQFDDLKESVARALESVQVKTLQVKGSVKKQAEVLEVFQKDEPNEDDPKILLLKMDDEQSAGLNLTQLNHAIFVHPLLAVSQTAYDAYETQAIGRIRRYGQRKVVHVHRFLVEDSIDTKIFSEKGGRELHETTGVV